MPDWVPVSGIYTAAGVHLDNVFDRDGGVTVDSDPKTCEYIHFDLSPENLGRTRRYNCWGFTFLPRRYWINSSTDVDNILNDNCDPVPDGSVRLGDVIRYRNDIGVTTHTGRVWQIDGAGHATKIRSKWGGWAEYIHDPLDVPLSYGTNLAYFRQRDPLLGIVDLWIKDAPGDNGEQYPGAPWWISPDILVDVPPYDGSPDLNPVFSHPNRVWALVRNRGDQPIENVYVRYYWADPAAGLAPADWHLIPATPGHPNPAGPISIPGGLSTEAPYVEWTPAAAPAHQCLLAIAYVGEPNDDPTDSSNPNPLVYPFNIPWDNNIAQRNVHVIELEAGGSDDFSINIGIPFDEVKRIRGTISVTLTQSPRLPIFGYAKRAVPLEVNLALDKRMRFTLKPRRAYLERKGQFNPDGKCLSERLVAGIKFPNLLFIHKKPHRLYVKITAPKRAKVGSVYYLHINQHINNMVTGGYTAAIIIV